MTEYRFVICALMPHLSGSLINNPHYKNYKIW